MTVIVTYDVSAEWWQVKEQAAKLNFYNVANTTVGKLIMPNTTLFIDNVTVDEAVRLFQSAVLKAKTASGHPIVLEKLMAGEIGTNWLCVSNRVV